MSNLSPSTLALLRAAKNDAPSKQSRNAIWGGVTSGLVTHTPLRITPSSGAGGQGASAPRPVTAPAAATTKGLATAAGLTGMKGAFVGALFGSAISIGVATFMLRTKPIDIPHAPLSAQASAQVATQGTQANNAATSMTTPPPASQNAATPASTEIDALPISTNAGSSQNSRGSTIAAGSHDKSPSSQASTSSSSARSLTDENQSLQSKKSSTTMPDDELLSRETALVVEARHDLLAGDAAGALKASRTARNLEARQFEPEEMKLEAAALRLLGRDKEAEKVESQRRTMYPNTL